MQQMIESLKQELNDNKHHINELINDTTDVLSQQNQKVTFVVYIYAQYAPTCTKCIKV